MVYILYSNKIKYLHSLEGKEINKSDLESLGTTYMPITDFTELFNNDYDAIKSMNRNGHITYINVKENKSDTHNEVLYKEITASRQIYLIDNTYFVYNHEFTYFNVALDEKSCLNSSNSLGSFDTEELAMEFIDKLQSENKSDTPEIVKDLNTIKEFVLRFDTPDDLDLEVSKLLDKYIAKYSRGE